MEQKLQRRVTLKSPRGMKKGERLKFFSDLTISYGYSQWFHEYT